jgi:hypothetical protein
MIWRAAALTVLCERDCSQDVIDRQDARDKLAATLRYFWPTIEVNGDFPGGNFWRPKSVEPDPLADAATVLLSMRQAKGVRRRDQRS